MEIILSAESIDVEEAYRLGLANKIFPKDSLIEEAVEFAKKFAEKGAIALRLAMQVIQIGLGPPLENACKLEFYLAALTWATEDAKEGVRAFLEKHKPIFRDR